MAPVGLLALAFGVRLAVGSEIDSRVRALEEAVGVLKEYRAHSEATIATLQERLNALEARCGPATAGPARELEQALAPKSPVAVDVLGRQQTRRQLGSAKRDPLTSHHEWQGAVLHQFGDSDACLGSDPRFTTIKRTTTGKTAVYDQTLTQLKVEMPAPLTVYHDGNCSQPPTLHVELPLHVENSLDVNGSLTIGGVDVVSAVATASVPPMPVCTEESNSQVHSRAEVDLGTSYTTLQACAAAAWAAYWNQGVAGVTWSANQGNR